MPFSHFLVYNAGMMKFELLEAFRTQLIFLGVRISRSPSWDPDTKAGPYELLIQGCLDKRWEFISDSPGLEVQVTVDGGFPNIVPKVTTRDWGSPSGAAADFLNFAKTCENVKGIASMLLHLAKELRMPAQEVARRKAMAAAKAAKAPCEEEDTYWAMGFLEG